MEENRTYRQVSIEKRRIKNNVVYNKWRQNILPEKAYITTRHPIQNHEYSTKQKKFKSCKIRDNSSFCRRHTKVMMSRKDKWSHVLSDLQNIWESSSAQSCKNTQAAPEHAESSTPPSAQTRNILSFTSESYDSKAGCETPQSYVPFNIDYNSQLQKSTFSQSPNSTKGNKLSKVINNLLQARIKEAPKKKPSFLIDDILEKETSPQIQQPPLSKTTLMIGRKYHHLKSPVSCPIYLMRIITLTQKHPTI